MHHAGFIVAVLQDFRTKVHVTDKCGRILVPRQMSQKAFVNEWIRKTGEDQFSARHLRIWIHKGSEDGDPSKEVSAKAIRRVGEAIDHYAGLLRSTCKANAGHTSPHLEVEKDIYNWMVARRVQGLKVTTYMLQLHAKEVLRSLPEEAKSMVNDTWVFRFRQRWGLRLRSVSSLSKKIPPGLLHKCDRFRAYVINCCEALTWRRLCYG